MMLKSDGCADGYPLSVPLLAVFPSLKHTFCNGFSILDDNANLSCMEQGVGYHLGMCSGEDVDEQLPMVRNILITQRAEARTCGENIDDNVDLLMNSHRNDGNTPQLEQIGYRLREMADEFDSEFNAILPSDTTGSGFGKSFAAVFFDSVIKVTREIFVLF